jgi:hypothetical protein
MSILWQVNARCGSSLVWRVRGNQGRLDAEHYQGAVRPVGQHEDGKHYQHRRASQHDAQPERPARATAEGERQDGRKHTDRGEEESLPPPHEAKRRRGVVVEIAQKGNGCPGEDRQARRVARIRLVRRNGA